MPIAIRGLAVVTAPAPAALPAPLAERIGRVERFPALALAAAHAALDDAGWTPAVAGERGGVVLGTAFGCFLTNAEHQRRLAAGGPGAASPRLFAATVSNAAAGEVAIAFGLAGPGITLAAAGVAGTLALGHAIEQLAAGRADVLVAGGVDAVGPALEGWCAASGFAPGARLASAAALYVLAPAPSGAGAERVLLGHAAGFVPDADEVRHREALAALVSLALARAGLSPSAVDVVAVTGAPAERVRARRVVADLLGGGDARDEPDADLPWTLAAAGPAALAGLLAGARGRIALVVDVCSTGHVAALVARTGGR